MTRKQPVEGFVKRHPDGFGFFIPCQKELPDAYIPRGHMRGLMSGDTLLAHMVPEKRGSNSRFKAKPIKVLERHYKSVVGRLFKVSQKAYLIVDVSGAWGMDLKVSVPTEFSVEDGDWVKARITSYPENFCAKVTEKIGSPENPFLDSRRVLLEHNIPTEFSPQTLKEVRKWEGQGEVQCKEGRRKDLTKKEFVTIDGEHAKDFDDAIFVERTPQGFHLSVAIADVSHYVAQQSSLDREAFSRGNSTYFPNFVNPMLPDILSNELCSLKPHVKRLAFVCDMKFDFQGELSEPARFYEALIKSHRRFTYGEVEEILEKKDSSQKMILRSGELAKIFLRKRLKQGSLDLDIPESVVSVSETGETLDVFESKRLFSHRLIEEFMLQANQSAARFLSEKKKASLYRIHEPPEESNILKLKSHLSTLGVYEKIRNQKQLHKISHKYKDTHHGILINQLILRAMNQACYSSKNVGHYALNFKYYTHFTSPIRRYADLIVHRLLKQALGLQSLKPSGPLEALCENISACEQRSVKAERHLIAIKKARFMEKFYGETFDGLITSVTKFGFFVCLRSYAVDGLVPIEDLREKDMRFDEKSMRLFSKKSGKQYQTGQSVQVSLVSVDRDRGKIEFSLIYKRKKKKKKTTKKLRKKPRFNKKQKR